MWFRTSSQVPIQGVFSVGLEARVVEVNSLVEVSLLRVGTAVKPCPME